MVQEHGLLQMWEEMALPKMVYASKLAIGPTKVILAFLAVVIICAGGLALDYFTHSVVVNPERKIPQSLFGDFSSSYINGTELALFLQFPNKTDSFIESYKGKCQGQGVFCTLWHFWTDRFNDTAVRLFTYIFDFRSKSQQPDSLGLSYQLWLNLSLCFRSFIWALKYHSLYSILFLLYSFVILCVTGGGICRCAALEFAGNEKPGLFEALEFVYEKFIALVSAPLVPVLLMTAFSFFLILIGLIANLPFAGELVISVLLVFLIIIGFLLTLLLAASFAGAGLMFPAIAYEGATGLDAIGRSICYVLNKPVWMVFYLIVQIFLGTFFYLAMRGLLFAVLWITYNSIGLGVYKPEIGPSKLERIWAEPGFFYLLGAPAMPAAWSEQAASIIIGLLMLAITAAIAAMVISFAFSSMTIIYALMRKKVDRIPIEKIWIHLEYLRP